jgi:uroporphyrinogen decarboxylase
MKEWVIRQLKDKRFTMPILTYPAVSRMGINVLDLVTNGALMGEGMRLIAESFPMSAALSCMDLSVEAEAFGANIKFLKDELPTVRGSLIKTIDDALSLRVPDIGKGRTSVYLNAVSEGKKKIKDRPVFAGVIGPFSLACRLSDMTELLADCYDEPDKVHILLNKSSEFISNYVNAFIDSGADGIVMAEPAAGLLSPAHAEEFSSKYIRNIFDGIKNKDFITVYHNCGNVIPLHKCIANLGADVYHFGNAVDILKMLELMPENAPIMGNLNPLLFKETPEKIVESVYTLLDSCSKHSNYIISTGCDVPASAKWECVKAYFDAIENYYL